MSENIERFNPYCGCVENVSECNTVVKRVSEVPSLGDATRNHVYLLPDNTAWIVNSDGTGFSQLNNSGAGEAYDDTDLKERLEELESKPDNDTKYRLTRSSTSLLPITPLKTIIESFTGRDQPLLNNPNISGDFIQYYYDFSEIIFQFSYDSEDLYRLTTDVIGGEIDISTGIGTKGLLGFNHSNTIVLDGDDEFETYPFALHYTTEFRYIFNIFNIHCLLSYSGVVVPIILDLTKLKDDFESNPSEPVKTVTIPILDGHTVTVEVFFAENFYNDSKASVISRGLYKLNEL